MQQAIAKCAWVCCIGIVCYQKVDLASTLAFIQGSRATSQDEVCVITEVSTLLALWTSALFFFLGGVDLVNCILLLKFWYYKN